MLKNYKEFIQRGSIGSHGKKQGQFLDPVGICSVENIVCVSDIMKTSISLFDTRSAIKKVSGEEEITTYDGVSPVREYTFPSVFDVAIHKQTQSLLVTDPVSKRIHCTSIEENAKTLFTSAVELPEFNSLCGIDVTHDGLMTVLDSESGRVSVCDSTGAVRHAFGQEGSSDGEFCLPQFVRWDENNKRLLISDTANARVQVFNLDGRFLYKFAIEEQDGLNGERYGLRYPSGIDIDEHGRIFVVDQGLHNVQIFDPDGIWLRTIGGPGLSPGKFNSPKSICLTKNGDFFVTDNLNSRIQFFS